MTARLDRHEADYSYSIVFVITGVVHIRHCPSRVYYDTLLTLLPLFATDVRGTEIAPHPSAAPADPSSAQSPRQAGADHRAAL
jgi:hypothetical protein